MAIRETFVRSPYNYDVDAVSDECGLDCSCDVGKAQQSFRDECDINEIVRRFGLTGELPADYKAPQYGDFTEVYDFQTAMLAVRRAEESFMSLPANVRSRFHNDPQELLAFVEDGSNRDEAIKLGVINAPVEVARDGSALPPVAAS